MKTMLAVVAGCGMALICSGQVSRLERVGMIVGGGNQAREVVTPPPPPETTNILHLGWPFREVNGVKYDANRAPSFHTVGGKVLQRIGPGRYLVAGWIDLWRGPDEPTIYFLVERCPFDLADDIAIPRLRVADVGLTNYTDVMGAKSTVRRFDYGTRIPKPAPVAKGVQAAGR